MTRTLALLSILSTLAAATLAPAITSAQEWLSDRRYSEGRGVSLGSNLVLHPGIGIEGGYDSNVFYSSPDEEGGVQSSGRLRISPHLDLATRPPQRLTATSGEQATPQTSFRLGLAGTYQEYLSDQEVITEQRNFGIDANLSADFMRRSTVSFRLADGFTRATEPANEAILGTYNRDYNRADASFAIAPGGRTLEFRLGYGFLINFYEDERFQQAGNFVGHDIYTTTRWKFLPKTAVVFDAHVTPTTYVAEDAIHPSSFPVRVRTGMNGLLTPRLSVMLMAGYGAGFYSAGDDFDSVIGQGELGYFIGPLARMKLGYQRDFVDSIFSNYYLQDRGYLEYNQLIAGKVLLGLTGAVSRLAYATLLIPAPGGPGDPSHTDRVDILADATLFGEYRVQDWLGINVSLQYRADFTNFQYTTGPAVDSADYSKLTVFGGVRAFY